MKIKRFEELNEAHYKYYDELSYDENGERLQKKFQSNFSDSESNQHKLRLVYLDWNKKLKFSDENLFTIDEEKIKEEITQKMKFYDVKFAYIITTIYTKSEKVGPNLKDMLDEIKMEKEAEKYNL